MKKVVSKIVLGLIILSGTAACSSIEGTSANTKLFSKDVVYHAYKNVGGDYSSPGYSDDYGYLFNSKNILQWSKSDGQEKTQILGEYKVSDDGHIWAKSIRGYSSSNFVLWGEITVGVLEVYEAASNNRSIWYITEEYYHSVVLGE